MALAEMLIDSMTEEREELGAAGLPNLVPGAFKVAATDSCDDRAGKPKRVAMIIVSAAGLRTSNQYGKS